MPANLVEEVDVERVPMGPDNPRGNAFTQRRTPLRTESEAQRMADNRKGRVWHITNPGSRNRLGEPVAYALLPEGNPELLADEDSSIAAARRSPPSTCGSPGSTPPSATRRATSSTSTPAAPGCPAFVAGDRDIDGQDLVVWHTFGLTHFPRPEDWPIMPVDHTGFKLKPVGFFDRNPALDVPPSRDTCHG